MGALPYVITGIAPGGSIPVSAAVGGALELNRPENLATGAAPGALPAGGARAAKSAVSPVLERVLGKGTAQLVENESIRRAGGLVRASGASADEASIRASLSAAESRLNAAVAEAAQQVPPRQGEATATGAHVLRLEGWRYAHGMVSVARIAAVLAQKNFPRKKPLGAFNLR